MNESLDLLKVLVAVGESKNFRDAGEKLNISQPAVSFKLRELQSLQPLPLFYFEGKRKVLTRYGRSLFELAREEFQIIERRTEDLRRIYSSPELLSISIGGRNEVLEHIAPRLEFSGRTQFVNLSAQKAIEQLLEHKIDVAISYILPDSPEIQAKRLFRSHAQFAVHEKFLIDRKLTANLTENPDFLLKTPCVFYSRDGHLLADWAKHIGTDFKRFNVKFVTEDWGTIRHLIENGAGFAILPDYISFQSSEVKTAEISKHVLKGLDFYALFERSLRTIAAFKPFLQFSKFR